MKNIISSGYFLIAGLTLIAVGSYIAISPVSYLGSFGSHELASIALMSDLRGMGSLMVSLGIFICSGVYYKSLRYPALLVSLLAYTPFVIARCAGFVLDGLPQFELLLAFVIESILALAGGVMLIQLKRLGSSSL